MKYMTNGFHWLGRQIRNCFRWLGQQKMFHSFYGAGICLALFVVGLAGLFVWLRGLFGLETSWFALGMASLTIWTAGFGSIAAQRTATKMVGITVFSGLIGMVPRFGVPAFVMLSAVLFTPATGMELLFFLLVFYVSTMPIIIWLGSLPMGQSSRNGEVV